MAKTEEKAKKHETAKAETAPAYITRYSIDELCDAAKKVFGVDPILARTALTMDGKESYSREEAEKIINIFKRKEVKR